MISCGEADLRCRLLLLSFPFRYRNPFELLLLAEKTAHTGAVHCFQYAYQNNCTDFCLC